MKFGYEKQLENRNQTHVLKFQIDLDYLGLFLKSDLLRFAYKGKLQQYLGSLRNVFLDKAIHLITSHYMEKDRTRMIEIANEMFKQSVGMVGGINSAGQAIQSYEEWSRTNPEQSYDLQNYLAYVYQNIANQEILHGPSDKPYPDCEMNRFEEELGAVRQALDVMADKIPEKTQNTVADNVSDKKSDEAPD